MLKKIAKLIIKTYQKLFSFDHSFWAPWIGIPVCRFHPTCSEYTYQAIDKYGVIKGIFIGFKRILRCNPWNKGGYDPIN